MARVLVTGAADFVGFHLCWPLLVCGAEVAGVDNRNDYSDVVLTEARLALLQRQSGFWE